jgi:hypothetical protein
VRELRIGKRRPHVVLLDDDDYAWAASQRWAIFHPIDNDTCYATTLINGKRYRMHRLLLGVTDPSVQVDHRDRNGLNNQRDNLRVCTNSQNQHNRKRQSSSRSPYKGICLMRGRSKPWVANIRVNGKQIHLGAFVTAEQAHAAYCSAARQYHGEFARAE